MKRALFFLLALGALVYLGTILTHPTSSKPILRVFTWSSYFDPKTIEKFEEAYQCELIFDIFDSNELMYAKLKSGREGYDIVTPSLYTAHLMRAQGMIQAMDWSKLPHLESLDRTYCKKEDYAPYFAPYLISFTGIGYLKSRVDVSSQSWRILADPSLRWRTTLLNDYRETLGSALMTLGFDPNFCPVGALDEAVRLLLAWKPMIAKFENEQYKLGLDSAEFLAVQGYSGDIAQLMDENEDVAFLLPKEGFTCAVDVFCIYRGSEQVDLAHAFIDFMHRPEIAAQNITHTRYLCPNKACYPLLEPSIRHNPAIFIPAKDMSRAHFIIDVGASNLQFLKAWDSVKSGR